MAILFALGGVRLGPPGLPLVAAALAIATLAWGRVRGRWLFEWLSAVAGSAWRRPPATGTVATVDIDGMPAGIVVDPTGRVAVVDIDGGSAATGPGAVVPDPMALLDAVAGASAVQLLLSVTPAPRSGPLAANYHQLIRGAVPAAARSVVAVRITGPAAVLPDAVRQVLDRLGAAGLAARPLAAGDVRRMLDEAAAAAPADPHAAGGVFHRGVLVRRCPLPAPSLVSALLPVVARLGTRCVISLLATGHGRGATRALVVRLTGGSPDALDLATRRLIRHLAALGVRGYPAIGEQVLALDATLPLARAWPGAMYRVDRAAGTAPRADHAADATSRAEARATGVPLATGGLFLGTDRAGEPVTLRLFRDSPTVVHAIGPREVSQMVVLRAAALGATVTVQSDQPGPWLRVMAACDGTVRPPTDLAPADPAARYRAASDRAAYDRAAYDRAPPPPELTVLDLDESTLPAPGGWPPAPPCGCLLVRRSRVTAANAAELARADLVLLAALSAPEADLAARILGSDVLRDWLDRVPGGMVALVAGGTLRWAKVLTNAAERALIDGGQPPVG